MNDLEFEQWKSRLWSLNRYEDVEDTHTFEKLLEDAAGHLDARVIDVLLDTYCDDDDYGIQCCVDHALYKADEALLAERLAEKFPEMQKRASQLEWPLLIIGGYVNAKDDRMLKLLVQHAKACSNRNHPLSMYNFIQSEYFLDEYPEMSAYLNNNGDEPG